MWCAPGFENSWFRLHTKNKFQVQTRRFTANWTFWFCHHKCQSIVSNPALRQYWIKYRCVWWKKNLYWGKILRTTYFLALFLIMGLIIMYFSIHFVITCIFYGLFQIEVWKFFIPITYKKKIQNWPNPRQSQFVVMWLA